jgi:hypothetical protein
MSNDIKKKERNYWPHAIIGILVAMVIACGFTVKFALDNPVQMDSFYLDKYQHVENNINDILAKQEAFEKKYKIEFDTQKFSLHGANTFIMRIKDLVNGDYVNAAKIKLVISRPDTNAFNQEYDVTDATNGAFAINGIKVDKPGRWQVLTKINIGDKSSYYKYEVFAN